MKLARTRRVPPMPEPGRRDTAVRVGRSIGLTWSILVTLVTNVLLQGRPRPRAPENVRG